MLSLSIGKKLEEEGGEGIFDEEVIFGILQHMNKISISQKLLSSKCQFMSLSGLIVFRIFHFTKIIICTREKFHLQFS